MRISSHGLIHTNWVCAQLSQLSVLFLPDPSRPVVLPRLRALPSCCAICQPILGTPSQISPALCFIDFPDFSSSNKAGKINHHKVRFKTKIANKQKWNPTTPLPLFFQERAVGCPDRKGVSQKKRRNCDLSGWYSTEVYRVPLHWRDERGAVFGDCALGGWSPC